MASSALIYTCATFKNEDGALEPMEKVLEDEIKLFGARLATCELLDSNNQGIIPAECVSFIPTEANTKNKGILGYISADGHDKPVPRYPDYDIATRQDRDRCVAALSKTSQAWSSYSNAKQTANQWCPAVRSDIEKDQMLGMYKAGAQALAANADALRSQTEILEQQKEDISLFGVQVRELFQVTVDAFKKYRDTWSDTEDKFQAGLQNLQSQLEAQINRSNAMLQDHDSKVSAALGAVLLKIQDSMAQHSTDVAIALSKSADDARDEMQYAAEVMQQGMMQILFNASSTVQDMAIFLSGARQDLHQFSSQLAIVGDNVMSIDKNLSNATAAMQQLQDQQKDLVSAIDNAKNSVAALESQILVISGHISSIIGTVAGIVDRFPAVAWYVRYVIVAVGALFLLKLLIGGPTLLQLLGTIFMYIFIAASTVLVCSTTVTKRGFTATASFLQSSRKVVKRNVGVHGAVLMLVTVLGVAIYFLVIESTNHFLQRWKEGDVSNTERFFIVVAVAFLVLYAIGINVAHRWWGEHDDEPEFVYDVKGFAV